MQYVWLEKMASAGDIRPEVKAKIYEDCSHLLKLAEGGPSSDEAEARARKAMAISAASKVMGVGANFLAQKVMGGIANLWDRNKTLGAIKDNRAAILKDPAFLDHTAKADARFTELAHVAPTIAAQPQRAKELVGKALHTGFTSEDMNHLAIIQAIYTAKDPAYATKMQTYIQKKASAERLGEMYADIICLTKEASFFGHLAGGIRGGAAGAGRGMATAMGGIRPSTAGQILKNVALVSSIPLLAGVGQGLINEYTARRDSKEMAAKLRESFNEALRQTKANDHMSNDQLAPHDNPAEALRAFQTLVHFAPHIAVHPDSARTFITRIMNNAHDVELPDVKQLTEIEKNLAGAGKKSPFMEGFSGAAKAIGLGEGLRSAIKDTTEPMREKTRMQVARDLGMAPMKQKG